MIGARDQGELVSLFYDAAIGGTTWEATLARAAELFRSQATLFAVHRPQSREVIAARSHNYDRDFLAAFFAGGIYAQDPRAVRIGAVNPGAIYFDEMLYDPAEMAGDPRVQAAIDTLGVSAQVGARLRLPQGGEATLAILRRAREPDALVDRVRAIAGLAPRFEQACAVGYMVEREHATRDSLLACLAAKADGVILLDRAGRAAFMNDAARTLLAEEDGLAFRDGLFCAARRPETEGLRKLVADALAGGCQGGGGRMLVSRASRRKPYVVSLLAPPAHETFLAAGSIACIVHIEDLADPPAPAAAGLAGVFGLTGREAMLAAALVRTARLDAAAAECGMALNTARNHLQAIFAKTGTCGQAELVQLLGRVL